MMPSNELENGFTDSMLLDNLNFRNCFDFDYVPAEEDTLRIQAHTGGCGHYLAYSFSGGEWVQGVGAGFVSFDSIIGAVGEGIVREDGTRELPP